MRPDSAADRLWKSTCLRKLAAEFVNTSHPGVERSRTSALDCATATMQVSHIAFLCRSRPPDYSLGYALTGLGWTATQSVASTRMRPPTRGAHRLPAVRSNPDDDVDAADLAT